MCMSRSKGSTCPDDICWAGHGGPLPPPRPPTPAKAQDSAGYHEGHGTSQVWPGSCFYSYSSHVSYYSHCSPGTRSLR